MIFLLLFFGAAIIVELVVIYDQRSRILNLRTDRDRYQRIMTEQRHLLSQVANKTKPWITSNDPRIEEQPLDPRCGRFYRNDPDGAEGGK